MEYRTVLLAALLHDIGKLIEKGDFPCSLRIQGKDPAVSTDSVGSLQDFFGSICDYGLLRELLQRHHERRDFPKELQVQKAPEEIRHLAHLISKAHNCSSTERGAAGDVRHDYKTTLLLNCFAQLTLDKPPTKPEAYEPAVLKVKNAFPQLMDTLDSNKMNSHLRQFGVAFDQLAKDLHGKPFEVVFPHLVALLRRFTWCIPSNTQENLPDISLYDHLRSTCAIAACLYQYHRETDMDINNINDDKALKFRLIAGDLSGIQRYIFGVSNIGAGGVGKRLRARSFLLSALAEAVTHRILHHFDLPFENVIVASGGHFYILAPNINGSEEFVLQFQRELDHWSFSRFSGEVRVHLAQVVFAACDFHRFSSVLEKIGMLMAKRKAQPLLSFLTDENTWVQEHFCRAAPGRETGWCTVCGRNPAAENADGSAQCEFCLSDHRLGTKLVRARYLAFLKGANRVVDGGGFPLFGDYAIDLLPEPPDPGLPAYLVVKLNDEELGDLRASPASFRYLANYIPVAGENECERCARSCGEPPPRKGEPLYFDCLAARAKGRKVLGYLKADVDHLGSLLLLGLRGEVEDRMSVSRLATVSRMLDLFFAGWVNDLMRSRFQNCYTVFSGGDDLLIIGPWDEILRLAIDVRNDFGRFTNHNPNVTLSAGIVFTKPRVPLSRSAEGAEEALEAAKDQAAFGEPEGRNQIAVFGEIVKWPWLDRFLETGGRLAQWHDQRHVSAGFLYHLKTYGRMYQEYFDSNRVENLQFIPLLTYEIARNLPDINDRDPEKAALRMWAETLKTQLAPNEEMVNLPLIVDYVLMSKE